MTIQTIDIDDETHKKLKYYKLIHGTKNISETIKALTEHIIIPENEVE